MPVSQSNGEQPEQGLDFRAYNELQIREIQRHKWIESEKAGRDLGQEAVFDWIHRYADSFRSAHGWRPAFPQNRSWLLELKQRLLSTFR